MSSNRTRAGLTALKAGDAVKYDQAVRQGGFDWQTFDATVLKVGQRRIKLAFDGREEWVTPRRVRKEDSNVRRQPNPH